MNRRWLLAAPLGVAAAAGVGFYAMLSRMRDGDFDPRGVPSALLDKPPPVTSLPALDGHPGWTDADLRRGGAPLLVNFFASWCVPCVIEHPQFMTLSREGVRILAVAYRDKPADSARFLAQRGNPFAGVVMDPEGRASQEWGLYGVPETYLVDAAGLVRWRMAGAITPEILADQLRPLLRRAA